MLKEFREFALQGNMVDLAVGVVIGAAFGTVVTSLVNDILTPVVSGLFGTPDFSNLFLTLRNPNGVDTASLTAARDGGATVIALGLFLNALIAFVMVAFALFMVVKGMNRMRREEAAQPEPAPAPPPMQETLLTEIRDLMRQQVRR